MNENDLKVLFRTQELDRREARQKIMLNHAALLDEEKPSAEVERQAVTRLRQAREEETRQRLNEIWNRLSWWTKIKMVFSKKPF